jgi:hypothetical protein
MSLALWTITFVLLVYLVSVVARPPIGHSGEHPGGD